MPMSPQALELFLLIITVFVGAFLGTALMRYLAKRYGWMVLPRHDRWHKRPTALHGGFGFFPAFLAGVSWFLTQRFSVEQARLALLEPLPPELRLTVAVLLGALVMFLFGWWDDLRQFRPSTKLLAQVAAASLFIFAGGMFPLTGAYVVDLLVTYFWFIGITNAVNMLDNMDGLSSGVVMLGGTTLVILTMDYREALEVQPLAVLVGLVFVVSLLGFWLHNRPPAAIFMGDSGSLSIGYVLAALAVPSPLNGFMGIHSGGTVLGPVLTLLIPATVLAVPIFDTTLVTITRRWTAQSASEGGRDHSSHRMVGLGLSEKKTVWILYSFSAFGGLVAVLVQRFPDQSLPLLGLFALTLVLAGVYLGHVKVQVADPARLPPTWTPLVTELLYKRRAAEVLLDTILIVICFYGAYLLRFEGMLSELTGHVIAESVPLVVGSCLLAFFLAGIYRGQWRLISVSDVPSYALGVFGGVTLSLAVVTLISRFENGHSRSAYIIFGSLIFITLVGSRLSFRLLDSVLFRNGSDTKAGGRKPVLIYGAGKAGKLLHEEFMSNPKMKNYILAGFVDDDPDLVGRKLCGVPIKSGAEWSRHTWNSTPEIWISSLLISDAHASRLAIHWNGKAVLRRLIMRLEPVGYGSEATTSSSNALSPPYR